MKMIYRSFFCPSSPGNLQQSYPVVNNLFVIAAIAYIESEYVDSFLQAARTTRTENSIK
jgi:hypothetical protein